MWIVLVVIAFLLGLSGVLGRMLGRFELDPAEKFALGGLLLTIIGGLAGWAGTAAPIVCIASLALGITAAIKIGGLPGKADLPKFHPASLAILACLLIPMVKAASPSDMLDWDTLAYHFAVPKYWLETGTCQPLPFIHQSHFPFLIDNLFVYGLMVSEPAAKAITAALFLLATVWVFGVARRRFSAEVGWWSAIVFASSPLVLWSSGSGYIDVANGWFAAIGLLYSAEVGFDRQRPNNLLILSGLGFGAAMASKYTGIQLFAIGGIVLVAGLLITKAKADSWKFLAISAALGIAIAAPWYVRNAQLRHNPVFPFFYEKLGGTGWDDWRAATYKNEQQTFGVGRTESGRDPLALGHSIFGLAYQPGRFINPGQEQGLGVPMGSVGIGAFVGLLGLLFLARHSRVYAALGAQALLFFVAWFFLSQQVRYLSALMPILAVLAGGTLSCVRPQSAIRALLGFQAALGWGMVYFYQTQEQLPVALGAVDRQAYQEKVVGFASRAKEINSLDDVKNVALYDEVFGYFLNKNYIWANPGHSMLIAHEGSTSAGEYVDSLKKNGVTHVYLSLQYQPPDRSELVGRALGIGGAAKPIDPEIRAKMDRDLNLKWLRLVTDSIAEGKLVPEKAWGRQRGPNDQPMPRFLLLKISD